MPECLMTHNFKWCRSRIFGQDESYPPSRKLSLFQYNLGIELIFSSTSSKLKPINWLKSCNISIRGLLSSSINSKASSLVINPSRIWLLRKIIIFGKTSNGIPDIIYKGCMTITHAPLILAIFLICFPSVFIL